MSLALLVALAGIVVLLLAVLCVLLVLALSGRRRMQRDLDSSRAAMARLQQQADELAEQVHDARGGAVPEADFVITTVGTSTVADASVPDHTALPAMLGEPLVRVVALGVGVRRALSAKNRNRIAFEMRREVKRARKRRRLDVRAARRNPTGHEDVA